MYSGSDSTESANYGQWPLNPAFFQNMPNEQVDWAALAQQWIQMKEAGPPIPELKQSNNIPEVKEVPQTAKEVLAPVASEDTTANSAWNSTQNSIEAYDSSWNWKSQPNWEWGNSAWTPHLNTPPSVNASAKPVIPVAKGYTSVDGPKENSTISAGYTSVKPNKFPTGYVGQSSQNHSRTYKPHNRRYSKVNVPKTNTPSPVNIPQVPEIESSSLDANKRKQLPAWIREGLEKMEKDKLKQMEREREKEKQTLFTEKVKEHEKEAMAILKDTINERRKSKFDSDDDQSPNQPEEKEEPEQLDHDQLITLVRRTMTEILLKVTNEAIHSICSEERQRFMTKTQTLGKVTGRTNIKAKLGLGMYGSDSGSESDNSDSSAKNSDDELKNSIRKKKAEFIQTEKGIEDKLQQAEKEKDNRKNKDESSSENHVEDYTPEKKKDEGNSKSKDSNSRYRRSSSRSTEESDDKWRSSSSRESSSSTKRRHRDVSRGRRYTPEKRKKQASKRSRSRSYERRHSSDRKYRKDRNRSDRSRRSRSRASRSSRRSRSRSSSYRSRRSSDRSSKSKRKLSRSPHYSRSSRRSRSRSHTRSSRR